MGSALLRDLSQEELAGQECIRGSHQADDEAISARATKEEEEIQGFLHHYVIVTPESLGWWRRHLQVSAAAAASITAERSCGKLSGYLLVR